MVISPEQHDVIVKVCLILGAVGFALVLVAIPSFLASWKWVNEVRAEVARSRPSDPDPMAIAVEVGVGEEYQP